MTKSPFKSVVVIKDKTGKDEVLDITGTYVPDPTRHFRTWFQLKFNYVAGHVPELKSSNLRFGPGYETGWEDVYFENNRPIRAEASNLFSGNRPVPDDYLRDNENYKAMIGFIPKN